MDRQDFSLINEDTLAFLITGAINHVGVKKLTIHWMMDDPVGDVREMHGDYYPHELARIIAPVILLHIERIQEVVKG